MYKLIIILLLSSSAYANTLDDKLASLNKTLNPKEENQIGYELDYQQNISYTWVNINVVQRRCGVHTTYVLKGHKIKTVTAPNCSNKWVVRKDRADILQVHCDRLSPLCVERLADELTLDVVKEIIDKNIENLEVNLR